MTFRVVLSEPTVKPEPEPGLNASQFYAINGHIFKDFRIGDDMTLSRKAVKESSAIFKKKDVPLAYKCSNIRDRGSPEHAFGNLIALHCRGCNWGICQSKGNEGLALRVGSFPPTVVKCGATLAATA
ncbi:hypothetical protein PG997_010729 [Apiospora hydei]|uniref:Uncharacterized protein n=1 Tax=Apiospora hydei TaxID=1337664 RepID=A0ABR1VH08_9PEZI